MHGKLSGRAAVLLVVMSAGACETTEAETKPTPAPGQEGAAAGGPGGAPLEGSAAALQALLKYDAKALARQMRTLDALNARADAERKADFLDMHAADPTRPLSRFLLAYAREDRRAAWRDLDGVRKSFPGSALGYLGMMTVYAEWRLVDQAEPTFEKATSIDPTLAVAHARIGHMYAAKGNTDKATAAYDKALQLDPDDADALVGKARLAQAAGDQATALTFLEKASLNWPESAALAKERAELLEAAGRRREAAQGFLLTAQVERRPYELFMRAAALLAQEGDRAAAEDVYRQALQHNPTDPGLLTTLGQLAAERGDKPTQMGYFARAVEQKPDDVDLHRTLAAHYLDKGESAGAERHLQELVRLAPEEQATYVQLARLYTGQGKTREAMENLQAAAELGPLDDAAAAQRAEMEKRMMLPLVPPKGSSPQVVFDAALKSIVKCYEARLKEKPGMEGAVTADVTVSDSGKVTAVKMRDDTIADEILNANIYFTLRGAIFPPGKKATYNYPLSFAPPKRGKKKK